MASESQALPIVWIADDSPAEAAMAERALEGSYQTLRFSGGPALIEQISRGAHPDALVLDWEMPELSGLEVCQFLRANPTTANLPILILTANGRTEDLVRGLAAGANDYVAKPFSSAELCARVAALVRARRMRERAERAERALGDVVAHLPDGVIGVDAGGIIRYANDEAGRMLDRASAASLIGTPMKSVMPTLRMPDSGAPAAEHLADVWLGDRRYAPMLRPIPVGSEVAATYAFRDVTEKRRAEARQLDFYSIIAHDLRTPLNSVMLRAEVLKSEAHGKVLPAQGAQLDKIQVNVRQMVELINDFLDLAKVEGAGIKVDREPTDLVEVVREALSNAEPAFAEKHVQVTLEAATAIVHGDRRRLMQVVSNLLSNAIKFTNADGRVTIRVERFAEHTELRVVDTGRGLTAETAQKLFQRYSRANDVKNIQGTGLGLLIVREIIEAHGGTVGVESEPGQGSTFWFTIPNA